MGDSQQDQLEEVQCLLEIMEEIRSTSGENVSLSNETDMHALHKKSTKLGKDVKQF
ncbi:hypothetical protein ACE1TI_09800 [Alteribacillus sp. JSM 102045]|uniref:hypothetical protein n=1 Tax=Alteribacillus sp. JSM 102045 TaxID=1562101 RepID=UPI0035BFB940